MILQSDSDFRCRRCFAIIKATILPFSLHRIDNRVGGKGEGRGGEGGEGGRGKVEREKGGKREGGRSEREEGRSEREK